jgi:hypothetical protein
MILNDIEKRWLEINFYLTSMKIYNNRQQYQDIINFYQAFEWTNLFDCAIIIKTLNDTNILYNPETRPTKYEFLLHLDAKPCRFKYTPEALRQLAKPNKFPYSRTLIYKTKMKEEVKSERTQLFPKFKTKGFHEAYYSFLLTLKYFGKLYGKDIKL